MKLRKSSDSHTLLSKARNTGCSGEPFLDHLSHCRKRKIKGEHLIAKSHDFPPPRGHSAARLQPSSAREKKKKKNLSKVKQKATQPHAASFTSWGWREVLSGLITAKGRQRLSWRPCVYVCVTHTNTNPSVPQI